MHPEVIRYVLDHENTKTPFVLAMLALGIVGWLVAYALSVFTGFKHRTYAIPIVAVALNFTWEVQAAFVWIARMHAYHLVWHLAFLAAVATDGFIVLTVFRYGRDRQVFPGLRRWYYPFLVVTFAGAWLLQSTFTTSFDDIVGFADGYLINLVMSILFIFMFLVRRDTGDLAYGLAWAKMLGTAGFSAVLQAAGQPYFAGTPVSRHPGVMIFLCLACFVLDTFYIGVLTVARRAPASAQAAALRALADAIEAQAPSGSPSP